jgi:hypothetical protein
LGPFGRTVQNGELLSKSRIFEDKFLASLEDRENPFHVQLEKKQPWLRKVPGLSEIFKYFNVDELMEGTTFTG